MKLIVDTFNNLEPLQIKTYCESVPALKIDEALDFISSPSKFKKKFPSMNKVIGTIEGDFFTIDKASSNGVWYSRKFWETVLSRKDIKDRLDRGMLGTIEHPRDDKDDSRPQYISHVVKKLWIKGDRGLGKAYVLDTPMGGILATLASATDEDGNPLVKYGVSVRAWARPAGHYKGYEVLDPNSYYMETFDVVYNPGVKTAFPKFDVAVHEAMKLYCVDGVCYRRNESIDVRGLYKRIKKYL